MAISSFLGFGSSIALLTLLLHTVSANAVPSVTNVSPTSHNSTFLNPILPGFHPDPSCIFVPEWDDTFFCASSSFNAFPGIPIHASKDLRNWKLIGHVLNREEQLPRLALTNRSTSGIWAPALRYHAGSFYVVTTLVNDDLPADDASRWDNMIFKGNNPFQSATWSIPKHFAFEGYDTSPFWDTDGQSYITGSHAYHVSPGIQQAKANIDTGEIEGEWELLWTGTGGLAPEGPHIYLKDGYYYLMIAEGGTGLGHMETIARSRNINGPYVSNPANPILTNANTTQYFQTVGHADLFQDPSGNWWGVALSTRSGPDWVYFPMGRETVLTPVTWKTGDWPVFSQVRGEMSGWAMPTAKTDLSGPFITADDDITFAPNTTLPAHFTYWRFPPKNTFTISPPGHPSTLRIAPTRLNLTALNFGNYAGPGGQAFVGRRQIHTLFTYHVDLDFEPGVEGEEAGVTVFLTQNHHLDLGVVWLGGEVKLRFRGESYIPLPAPIVRPLPGAWVGKKLRLEIKAGNETHFEFAAGLADGSSLETILSVSNAPVSWGFTGTLLGVYCTSNGGPGKTPAYFSNWRYIGQGQIRD